MLSYVVTIVKTFSIIAETNGRQEQYRTYIIVMAPHPIFSEIYKITKQCQVSYCYDKKPNYLIMTTAVGQFYRTTAVRCLSSVDVMTPANQIRGFALHITLDQRRNSENYA